MEDFERFRNNVEAIRHDHNRCMNEIRRQGRKEARIYCPIVILLFLVFAQHNLSKGGDFGTGLTMLGGAIAFLLLLVSSEIFNRPREVD